MGRVLVFGAFDGVHDGHRAMLREAKALGSYLVVAVAQDAVIEEIKGHTPKHPLKTRLQQIKDEHIADEVVSGDKVLGGWTVIKKYKPNVIALGYDQHQLRTALEEYFAESEKKPTIISLQAHKPEQYKSSLLNK